ncbi:hypothetical protein M409DRAFT_71330 [Zasmidium cellare ATCC 36951]|uniref:Uncharacterized protein n=1 Tax=Zasmidium cellare ATCC 36951 TaxID=1080233 RepID=A0A6A6BZH1_ZASCE|nr:uncharacterized protein M409DRAFT_71330 [Zasmidium cellare ATCC 36951]KAF2158982.1 hypothetical protein M409DRAFT_71330 [Zasmidium cellare ATCC 36951]
MAAAIANPSVVRANLNYLLPGGGADADGFYPGTASNLRRKFDVREVPITDVRSVNDTFDIDKHGFKFVPREGKFNEFDNKEQTAQHWYPEVIELLKKHLGAADAKPLLHFVRNETVESALADAATMADHDTVTKMVPFRVIHVDNSYDGSYGFLEGFVGSEEAEKWSKGRWGIVNVWYPLKTVERDPLAVCDASSVREEDLYPLAIRRPADAVNENFTNTPKNMKANESWHVYYNDEHRWYYKSKMTPEEALLIRIYDSEKDGRARRCPHTAFELADQDAQMPNRTSIETRCVVRWDDE